MLLLGPNIIFEQGDVLLLYCVEDALLKHSDKWHENLVRHAQAGYQHHRRAILPAKQMGLGILKFAELSLNSHNLILKKTNHEH